MAILEKEVLANIVSGNAKYYESKGYDVPKYIDKYKILRYKVGSKILVRVEDLPKGSDVEVTKVCDECGTKVYNQPYGNVIRVRNNGDGVDRCKECGGRKGSENQKNNVKFERSLEFWAKENDKEYLLLEFSDKNSKPPAKLSWGTSTICIWNCPKCLGEYKMKVNKRTSRDSNCPYCASKQILIGYNDLFTTYPEIANMLIDKQKGYQITSGSNKKEDFKCNDCGYIMRKKLISDAARRGLHCPRCSDGISYPEKFLLSVLEQTGVIYEVQKVFNWSDNKRYDFYVDNLNTIIEIHGEHHFTYTGFTRTLKDEQENDTIKRNLALNNGIEKYIVIDARKSEMTFLKESISKSGLCDLVDFSNINWEKCNEYACNSLIKEACNLWNSGMESTKEIGKNLKIHSKSIIDYLKIGAKLGWCNYTPTGTRRIVVQLTLHGRLIKEWESATEAGRVLGINRTCITETCQGRQKSSGGFKWIYKKDFDELSDLIK